MMLIMTTSLVTLTKFSVYYSNLMCNKSKYLVRATGVSNYTVGRQKLLNAAI